MSDVPDIYEWADAQHRAERARKAKAPKLPAVPKGTKRATPERDAQKAVVAWLRKAGCIVAASVNESPNDSSDPDKRARFYAARARAGVLKGWPDLTVITPRGEVVWVEMKSAKGKPSEAQAALHQQMRERGCVVVIGRDVWSVQSGLQQAGVSLAWPAGRLAR